MTRQQEYEARLLLQTRQIRICRIMILILFLSLWELTASLGLINRFIFSSPSQILFCLWNMLLDKSLFLHTGVTLTETLLSFLLCTLISLLTALFLWSSPFAAQIFEPFLVLLNSLPKSALAPLLLVWLGNRMRTVIVAAVSIAVFGSVMTLYTGFNHGSRQNTFDLCLRRRKKRGTYQGSSSWKPSSVNEHYESKYRSLSGRCDHRGIFKRQSRTWLPHHLCFPDL